MIESQSIPDSNQENNWQGIPKPLKITTNLYQENKTTKWKSETIEKINDLTLCISHTNTSFGWCCPQIRIIQYWYSTSIVKCLNFKVPHLKKLRYLTYFKFRNYYKHLLLRFCHFGLKCDFNFVIFGKILFNSYKKFKCEFRLLRLKTRISHNFKNITMISEFTILN